MVACLTVIVSMIKEARWGRGGEVNDLEGLLSPLFLLLNGRRKNRARPPVCKQLDIITFFLFRVFVYVTKKIEKERGSAEGPSTCT